MGSCHHTVCLSRSCALTQDNVAFGDTEPFHHHSWSQLCCGRYEDTFLCRFEFKLWPFLWPKVALKSHTLGNSGYWWNWWLQMAETQWISVESGWELGYIQFGLYHLDQCLYFKNNWSCNPVPKGTQGGVDVPFVPKIQTLPKLG